MGGGRSRMRRLGRKNCSDLATPALNSSPTQDLIIPHSVVPHALPSPGHIRRVAARGPGAARLILRVQLGHHPVFLVHRALREWDPGGGARSSSRPDRPRSALPLIAPTVHHASGPSYPFGGSNARVQPFDLSPASGGSRNSRPSCPRDKPDANALGPGPGSVSPGCEDGRGER